MNWIYAIADRRSKYNVERIKRSAILSRQRGDQHTVCMRYSYHKNDIIQSVIMSWISETAAQSPPRITDGAEYVSGLPWGDATYNSSGGSWGLVNAEHGRDRRMLDFNGRLVMAKSGSFSRGMMLMHQRKQSGAVEFKQSHRRETEADIDGYRNRQAERDQQR